MKRFLTLFFLTLIIFSGSIFALRTFWAYPLTPISPVSTATKISSSLSPIPPPLNFIPDQLVIEKLGIRASVESVGMDQQGRMDVPKDPDNVGWYNLGYIPGEVGSAVLAGHFDRIDGSPAVFYDLTSLEKGDRIEVRKGNKKLTFEVTQTETFEATHFPMKRVFDNTNGIYLNLITCDGVFDKSKKSYTERYVVFSELKAN